ncbi:MAG: hypothetical protein H3C34_13715 [Caldilineaceae bacterium]|nr:hypothetical protein [Caldilineaceae bacterium]
MSFLKNLFGGARLDGDVLARSKEIKEYAQIDLLSCFVTPRLPHEPAEQKRWSRVLPKPYMETLALLQKQGWLAQSPDGFYQVTAAGMPFVETYRQRTEAAKAEAMAKVRKALEQKMTSEALTVRRQYENLTPLGKADWTGPEPQMDHSAVTRRIFFLEHWLLDGLSPETQAWLKLYAAEEHLWGAYWRQPAAEIPSYVQAELARADQDISEAAYWKAYQLGLYVDNQETWQRCKGGDHVRRMEIVGPDDEFTCEHCRAARGKEYLVVRVPELPHRECTSPRGCRCRYEPVLETVEEIPLHG